MSYALQMPVRLVLIDDDPAQLRILERVLRRGVASHIEIEGLTDPREALDRLQSEWVDILLTDLSMPEISGLDLLRCVKERNRFVQVLLITAVASSDALLEAIDLGASDYLLKPVDHQLLVGLVNQAADRLYRWREALAGTLQRAHRPQSEGRYDFQQVIPLEHDFELIQPTE
jgi:DNA-binding NtrC family response regulator